MTFPEYIIKEARLTEKTAQLSANLNQYTFEVFPNTNSTQIKQAIEKMFGVKVSRVNTVNTKGKLKRGRNRSGVLHRTPLIKKAIVTLQEGHKIELI